MLSASGFTLQEKPYFPVDSTSWNITQLPRSISRVLVFNLYQLDNGKYELFIETILTNRIAFAFRSTEISSSCRLFCVGRLKTIVLPIHLSIDV